jgi:hypothetical protein
MRRLAAAALVTLAVAACGSTAGGSSMLTGFAGYKWSVVAISHDGRQTSIPAHYNVYLQFAPNGQYGANDPVILLSVAAIHGLDDVADASVKVTGNRLDVAAGGYTLTCQRAGEQANFPPAGTN